MKLELCKTGKYNDVVIQEKDLNEMEETFSGRVPIVIGHQKADYLPAFGWITSVKKEGTTLLGEVELNDLMKEAWDKGYYRNWSISARKGKDDGKFRLRHLAMLGATPPAIKDLQVVSLTENGGGEEILIENQLKEEDLSMIVNNQEEKDKKVEKESPREQSIELSELNLLKEKLATLEAENQKMKKQYREAKLATLTSAIEGKVPKDKAGLVISLAEQMDQEQEITLSENEKESAIDVLTEIFTSIALPVKPGELDLGENPDKGEDKEEVKWNMGGRK